MLVGLEPPRDEQVALEQLLAGPEAGSGRAALPSSPFWRRVYQDGRSSRAMAALLGRLAELARAGWPIEVVAFDVPQDAIGPERDARMAERLAAAARARPEVIALAYVGNFHARTTMGAPWDPAARPMGWHLRHAGLRVRSLDCAGPAGTSWSCTGPDAASCGLQAVDLGGVPGAGPAIEFLETESAAGFAGRFLVPTLTASPPAAVQ